MDGIGHAVAVLQAVVAFHGDGVGKLDGMASHVDWKGSQLCLAHPKAMSFIELRLGHRKPLYAAPAHGWSLAAQTLPNGADHTMVVHFTALQSQGGSNLAY